MWLELVQIFNAILLSFSRRLRNSPRPWVKHTQRPTTSDSLEKPHQKAKSSMSLQTHQNFILDSSLDWHLTFYFFLFSICINNKRKAIFRQKSGNKNQVNLPELFTSRACRRCEAQGMKLWYFTANPLQQSRCGEIGSPGE